jgi:hypothetical protein
MSKVLCAPALCTFSDVGWDRKTGSLNLITECEDLAIFEYLKNRNRKSTRAPPNIEIFERLISHT